ncbi:hypothetical protein [uncultured Sphaerochaeta sp.]|uniref:hypothetical protein n=1 Tax=uncultured Sphaerochaeta sp. TaxID=886478 RepID=UPI002AA8A86C|nr:hypothetical protein [uncultured Sphaerochaeta sp.]
MNNRFYISTLSLTGKEIKETKVNFTKGLNFVTGPSDTGKTFILNCIDYMFGASDLRMEIPELTHYDTIHMELIDSSNSRYSISRDLKGGSFKIDVEGKGLKKLAAKHDSKNLNNLSNYLLNEISLANKIVIKNSKCETRSLSYRDIAHLTIVPEDKIVKNVSPIYVLGLSFKTVEKSIFNLLLSGGMNEAVAKNKEEKDSDEVNQIKKEIYKEEIILRKQKLKSLNIENNSELIDVKIDEIASVLLHIQDRINTIGTSLSQLELDRKNYWEELKKIQSKKEILLGLLERFTLLQGQYDSDLGRLEAIKESWNALNKIKGIKKCPLCGALPEYHDDAGNDCNASEKSFLEACNKEILNITILEQDLDNTVVVMKQEVTVLSSEEQRKKVELGKKIDEINNTLNPKIHSLLDEYQKMQRDRDALILARELFNQIKNLQEQLRLLEKNEKVDVKSGSFDIKNFCNLNSEFCERIESILKAWKFPNNGTVEFDEMECDLIIGGKKRNSHGKGVRAITHAAFSLGLLDYCNLKKFPHPGIVILDSPLIVYKEPDREESNFSRAVKENFIIDTAERFKDSQIIVLENEPIDRKLETEISINIVRFTGSNHGRFGFLLNQD